MRMSSPPLMSVVVDQPLSRHPLRYPEHGLPVLLADEDLERDVCPREGESGVLADGHEGEGLLSTY